MFLARTALWAAEMAAIVIICSKMEVDPVWCLLGLWMWKDLTDEMCKK